ncbi:MAG TPA: L-threonylcarbamoyladenylate synthase [Thermoanaerobaculia bacterium]|nr:L-threonylcarbamoyladenylate synthase [Thermoanaerobaculia bacterium]
MTPGAAQVPVWHWGDPVEPLAACLERGGLIAIPTESSYGLGADPGNSRGVAAVYRLKGRSADQPLPVVVADLHQLPGLGIAADLPILERLSQGWPGPLSVLLPLSRPLPAAAGAGSLAVRIPGHARLRSLLAALDRPLTATSANRSGEAPILDPAALPALLAGFDAVVIDDGRLPGGPPSTLVEPTASGVRVLREGSFGRARLAALLAPGGRLDA